MSILTNEKLEDYEPLGPQKLVELDQGYFAEIRKKTGKRMLVRVLEKKDKLRGKIEANEKNAARVGSRFAQLVFPVKSIIHANDNFYLIYDLPLGASLKTKLNELKEDEVKSVARQFYVLTQKANAKGLYFMKETPLENLFVSDKGLLTYVSLDTAFYEKGSKISDISKNKFSPQANLDLLTFAGLLHQLLTKGKNLYSKGKVTIDPEVKDAALELISQCINPGYRMAGIDVLNSAYLKKEIDVKFDEKEMKLTLDNMSVQLKDGVSLALGDNEFSVSTDGNVTIKGGGCTTTIGAAGLKIESEDNDAETKQTVTSTMTVGAEGLALNQGDNKTTLGAQGFSTSTADTTTTMGANGFEYAGPENTRIAFGSKLDVKIKGVKPKMGLNMSVATGKLFFSIGVDGVVFILGDTIFKAKTDIRFSSCGMEFCLGRQGLDIAVGGKGAVSINAGGLYMQFGDIVIAINASGLTLEGAGLMLQVGKEGVVFKNGMTPIDLNAKQVNFDFKNLKIPIPMPKVPLPGMPPIPAPKLTSLCNVF